MEFNPSNKAVLVIGDIILDEYVHGNSYRLSPEAPVPVVHLTGKPTYRLGGAANVAANIKTLGGTPILAGSVGFDNASIEITNMLLDMEIDSAGLIRIPGRISTLKTRIVANNQQVVRLDYEDTRPLPQDSEAIFIRRLRNAAAGADISGIIISDYAKGTLTAAVLYEIGEIAMSASIPVYLDPKMRKGFATPYYSAYVITPNARETETFTGIPITDNVSLERAARLVRSEFRATNALITQGEKGMTLCSEGTLVNYSTKAVDVFDVSGAGDTVIAALALANISGYSLPTAVDIANHAAGVVVGKHGTSVCTLYELHLTLK